MNLWDMTIQNVDVSHNWISASRKNGYELAAFAFQYPFGGPEMSVN